MENYIYSVLGVFAIFCAFGVIISSNPVNSLLFLVGSFLFVGLLMIMSDAEFIGWLLLVVYVGAIAILFLFVVMMLNIKFIDLVENSTRYIPIGLILGLVFIYELKNRFIVDSFSNLSDFSFLDFYPKDNLLSLGSVLYTDYAYYFIIGSLILLVGMIGAIVLSLHHSEEVRRQDIFSQVESSVYVD